jgi:hypothetical protein
VLAVGAVDRNGQPAAFSSYGPSSDGQVKPDVASVGVATVVQTTANTIGTNNGTSFSCPNMVGLVTCIWQGFPEFNNMKIIDALRRSGSKASAPDDKIGYGIPDMKKAVLLLLADFSTAAVSASSCKNTLSWTSKDIQGMRYEIERRAAGETGFTKVDELPAGGTAFGARNYQYADSLVNVQAGAITYRIRQVIDTATATLSAGYIDTLTINLGATCTTTPVTNLPVVSDDYRVLPNPAQSELRLRISTQAAMPALILQVVDAKGGVVLEQKNSKGPGTVSIPLSIGHLAKGKYYLVVYKDGVRLVTREFMKL